MDNCSQHKKDSSKQSPFSKAWEEYKITEKFKELKKAVNAVEKGITQLQDLLDQITTEIYINANDVITEK